MSVDLHTWAGSAFSGDDDVGGARHQRVGRSREPTVSVLVPTLNEEKNLPYVLPLIPDFVDEIVLIDGYSTDRTVEVARELVPDVEIVMEPRRGKGRALRTGYHASSGDILVAIDADGSTDPREIPRFVDALISEADFVKGSRFMHGGGTADMEWYRKCGNWVLTRMVRASFGGNYTDLCYGYFAFWRDVLPVIDDPSIDGFEVETYMNIRVLEAPLVVREVPSFEHPRIHGTSNLRTVQDGLRVMRTIVRESLRQEPELVIDLAEAEAEVVDLSEAGLASLRPRLEPPAIVRRRHPLTPSSVR